MLTFVWVMLLMFGTQVAAAQDAVAVSPDSYKVEIDNQWVRVLRLKQAPHAKTALHERGPSVTVYLGNSHEKFTDANGRAHEASHKQGEASYSEAGKWSQENLGGEPLEQIIVELKPGAPKGDGLPPAALDPAKSEPEHVKVLLENERVRVLHTVLAAHVKNPLHAHPHNVVTFVIAPDTMTTREGKTVDNPRKAGTVRWADATQHATENATDKDTLEIQVELK